MLAAFRRWRGPSTPIAIVTSLAAVAITISGVVDIVFQTTGGLPVGWTVFWTAFALLVSATPFVLGSRFPGNAGIYATVMFVTVTVIQVLESDSPIVSANNLVLYPMLGCYVGWFYGRIVYRTLLGLALVGTFTAVLVNPLPGLITVWINLALATTFCTEAAGYLRSVLDRQIATDPLTGATTRAGLTRRIERELDRSTRTGEPVSAIIIDVDDFKSINDRDGHAAGDRFLVDLVATIRAHIRPYDTVARLGGDEFLLLLPASDREAARALADRLQSVTTAKWSYGVAEARGGDTVEALLARADQRLYEAKRQRSQYDADGSPPALDAPGSDVEPFADGTDDSARSRE